MRIAHHFGAVSQKVGVPVVAAGTNAASPHHDAGQRVIQAGEVVLCDFGGTMNGYCSDITRMVWCGAVPDPRWQEHHDLVNRAREAALEAVGATVAAQNVDAAARGVIADADLADAFTHGTGHGVGLEIHEAPTLSARGTDELEDGMVVTIEPAVYLPGEFGIRVEDMVQVVGDGHRRLTTLGTEPILPKIP